MDFPRLKKDFGLEEKMSLETWKAEYYPVPATEVAKADAVAHSLRKWEGLRLEAVERYGLAAGGRMLRNQHREAGVFMIIDTTCALCIQYLEARHGCPLCPLKIVRGVPCDVDLEIGDHTEPAPYVEYIHGGDPEPMISWLNKAGKWEEEQASAKT